MAMLEVLFRAVLSVNTSKILNNKTILYLVGA